MAVVASQLVERDSEPEEQTDLWEPASLFVADWSSPIQFSNSYTTVVHESRTGLESRAGVATKPRKTLMNQSLILSDSDVQHMKSTMRRAGEARTLTPLFCDPCPLVGLYNPQHPYGPSWAAKNVADSRLANTGWSALVLKDNTPRAKTYAFCRSTTVSPTTNEVTFCDPDGETGCCYESILGGMSFGNPAIIANGSSALGELPSSGSTVSALMDTSSPNPKDGDHVIFCLSYNIKRGETLTVTNMSLEDKGGIVAINQDDGFVLMSSKVAQSELDNTVDRRVDVYRAKVQIRAAATFGVSWDASFTIAHSSTGASSMIFDAMILDHSEIDATNPYPPSPVEVVPWTRSNGETKFSSSYQSTVTGESVIELITAQASSANDNWDATGATYTTPIPFGWVVSDFGSVTTNTTGGASFNYEVMRDFRIAYCTTTYGVARTLNGQLNERGLGPTTQSREGMFTRIRINPSIKNSLTKSSASSHVLYPAIETDLSFGMLSEVVTREIAVVQNEANETIGIEGADPQIEIGSLPPGRQTVEHFVDGGYVTYPVLERSPSFDSMVWENSIVGDEAQYGIGRERSSYGKSRMKFVMQYRFLNRPDAFDMIEFFQSRGGRLHPFFLVPPTTEFTVTGVGVIEKNIVVEDNSLQDDELDDSIGRYVSVYNGSSYAVRQINSWSRSGSSITFTLNELMPSTHLEAASLDRAGIAHMCRFNQDEMMETWTTSSIMETMITAIELIDEGIVSIQPPQGVPSGVGCSQMLCGNSEEVGVCPTCCEGSGCEDCSCVCPQGNTMACGYCGNNSSCGPNPTDPALDTCLSGNLFDHPVGSGISPFCSFCTATMTYKICMPKMCCGGECAGDNPEICHFVCENCCVTLEPEFVGCATHAFDGNGDPACWDDIHDLLAVTFGESVDVNGGEVFYMADTGASGKVLIGIQTGFVCDDIDHTTDTYGTEGPEVGGQLVCSDAYDGEYPSRKYSSGRWRFWYSEGTVNGALPKENDPLFFDAAFGVGGCGGWAGSCACGTGCGWYSSCNCGTGGGDDIMVSSCSDRIEQDNCNVYEKKRWWSGTPAGCCDMYACGPVECHRTMAVFDEVQATIQSGGCGQAIDPVEGDDQCGDVWPSHGLNGGCPNGCNDFGGPNPTDWCN